MIAALLGLALLGADEKAVKVKPEQLAKHVGKLVEVVFEVKSIEQDGRSLAIFNSKKNPKDKGNFRVIILRADKEKFQDGHGNLAEMQQVYLNKLMEVRGKVTVTDQKLEIILRSDLDLAPTSPRES